MNYPTPHEVNTNSQFTGVCNGLPQGSAKEATVRVFCITAKKHNTWFLTQEQLDERDRTGSFYWNGMIREGWFETAINSQKINPTDVFFKRLIANGLIESVKEEKPTLKLFTCRVIYTNQNKRNSWFTVLDVSENRARLTCEKRVAKFKHLRSKRGQVSTIEIREIVGPFEAGQILHEER